MTSHSYQLPEGWIKYTFTGLGNKELLIACACTMTSSSINR